MRYNTLFHVGYKTDSFKIANAIKNAGFDGVFFNMNQKELIEEDIKIVRDFGLNIETLHLPYNNPYPLINHLWYNDNNVEKCISIFESNIDFAAMNSIHTVIMHASSGFSPPEIKTEGILNFKKILDICEKRNIILAIENIKSFDHVYALLTAIDSKNLRLCFDIGHANAFTQDLFSSKWEALFKKLHCVHIHDNDGINDLHLMPSYGNLDMCKILSKLLTYNPNLEFTSEAYYEKREKYYNRKLSVDAFFLEAYQHLRKIKEKTEL